MTGKLLFPLFRLPSTIYVFPRLPPTVYTEGSRSYTQR